MRTYCGGCLRPMEGYIIAHDEEGCVCQHRPHPNRVVPKWGVDEYRYLRLAGWASVGKVRTWDLRGRLPRGLVLSDDERWLREMDLQRLREGRPLWH